MRSTVLSLVAALLLVPALAGCVSAKDPGAVSAASVAAARRADDDAEALFSRAQALREKAQWSDARAAFTAVYEDFPASPLAMEAQFQAAECAYGQKKWWAAGNAFARFIEDRPLSAKVDVVEKRLYDIGDFLIEDGKRGLWGTGWFTWSEEGVEILRRMTALLPTGTWADDALLRIGRYYAATREYEGAEQVLDQLLKEYPSSEWRLEARFLLAWTFRKDNRGPEYDGERLRRARAHFLAFVEEAGATPDRAAEHADRIAAARDEVAAIEADLARKAIARSVLYRRKDRLDAAIFTLEEAARQWGATAPGREAAALAAGLRGTPPTGPPAAPVEGGADAAPASR